MTPKVSIIFTSYNHRKYLKQALDSIIEQSFKDFELIIVDDCSTDGSQEILKSYDDIRIRLYLNKKNSGSYVNSSNYGASMAKAPYLIFAQCDDWAESTQLEKLVSVMETHSVDVVFSCSNMVDERGNFIKEDYDDRGSSFHNKHSQSSIIPQNEMRKYMLRSCVIPNLSAAMIKKSLYLKLNGLSTSFLVMADWDFWLRASSACNFYYIREPLNNFRQHNTTIRSAIKMERQMTELFYMMFTSGKTCNESSFIISMNVCVIWICWMSAGVFEWLSSFPALFKKGCKYTFYFPFSFILALGKALFNILANKIGFCKKIND